LLDYAVKKGLEISDDVINSIAKSKYYLNADWDAAKEAEFQKSFNALCKLTAPVTIESIKAINELSQTEYLSKKQSTLSESEVNSYRRLTAFFLVTLLIFQIIWSFGSTLITDLNEIPDKLQTANIERANKASTNPESLEVSQLELKIMSYQNKLEADFILLENLSFFVPDYLISTTTKDSVKDSTRVVSRRLMLQQCFTFAMSILQAYILPLLYGFVGACVYILRTISSDIESVTFIPSSQTRYSLRWQLGGLSGLAIGWLAKSAVGTAPNISQLALAFVAGYSVDLLFTLMDKIVATFTSSK
jgi:hypothetical protein